MKELTRQWLNAAKDDLHAISKLITEPDLSNMVAFHAQQTVEKSLKAYIEEKDIFLPKTHDLVRLCKLSGIDFSIEELEVINTLNDLYINARYPGELGLLPEGKPTESDCIEFENLAKIIYGRTLLLCK
jgi:HEPN domain-containing protein